MSTMRQLGPLMVDVAGTALSAEERHRLLQPAVGGVILFARNYASPTQLAELCAAIHALRTPALLIGIDHEGGRVQRCRDGFTRLPAMRQLGSAWDADVSAGKAASREMARAIGYVLASELRLAGVDFSFTPVLDLDWGRSSVIGSRAFHHDPAVVSALAGALIAGLHQAGMRACGKHFPGHGWVEADSHVAIPVDERSLVEMVADLLPYRELRLDAVMPAHVSYPAVAPGPAGFSPFWINFLRQNLGFDGVIFSDDLSMAGASLAGDAAARARAAARAGCDVLLLCNDPVSADAVIAGWDVPLDPASSARLARLRPDLPAPARCDLAADALYQAGIGYAERLCAG